MKWIFYSLILVNIVFAAYLYLQPPGGAGYKSDVDEESSIQLLSERRGKSTRDIEVEEVLENPIVVAEVEDSLDCQGLGPFEDIVSAQDITERLNGMGVLVNLRAVDEETGEYDYRVVIPPVASLQEAFRRLRELKSQDIDSYVISQGEDAQGISLGVFSSQSAASDHQQTLADEGYETVIREIARVVRGYWVFADRDVAIPEDEIQRAINTNPSVSLTESACLN